MNYAIANSAVPDDPNAWPYEKDWNKWPGLYSTGTPGTGYADIVNTTQKLVWEAKTGGGLSNMGSDWPSPYYTVPRGVAQAGWYVARLNILSKKTIFNVGSIITDNEIATALKLCGGICEIEYSDGTTLWIQSPAPGVLAYRLNTPDPTGPKKIPVVVGIKAKSGADVYLLVLALLYALLPKPTSLGGGGYPPAFAGGGGGCSFRSDTMVWTIRGEVPIGQLIIGDTVFAYNAEMHVIELQPVLHVWIQTDDDLFNVTIVIVIHDQAKVEVVHTTSRHPFLTLERGFIPVSQLQVGMHVLGENGDAGIVTNVQGVPGSMIMYNLEVANDHTFVVGAGQWIVHNKCGEGWPEI